VSLIRCFVGLATMAQTDVHDVETHITENQRELIIGSRSAQLHKPCAAYGGQSNIELR
jgi:hypothetical protein